MDAHAYRGARVRCGYLIGMGALAGTGFVPLIHCMTFTFASAQPAGSGEYVRQFNTIGHYILDFESVVAPAPESAYVILDELITESIRNTKYDPTLKDPEKLEEQAVDICKTIASILDNHDFRLTIPTHSLTDTLTAQTDEQGAYYEYDCDTSSFIYLAIAEANALPLHFIEVPIPGSAMNHNFVRWDGGGGVYIDWDTNRKHRRAFSDPKGIYGSIYSRRRLISYLLYMRGLSWKKKGNMGLEVQAYRESIWVDPVLPHSSNNLAWLYVTNRKAQELITGEEALNSAIAAVSVNRDANVLDTLASVHAELGNLNMAVFIETEAVARDPSNAAFRERLKGFQEGKTVLEQQDPAADLDEEKLQLQESELLKNTEGNSALSLHKQMLEEMAEGNF